VSRIINLATWHIHPWAITRAVKLRYVCNKQNETLKCILTNMIYKINLQQTQKTKCDAEAVNIMQISNIHQAEMEGKQYIKN